MNSHITKTNYTVIFHAWACVSGCGITTLMNKFLKGRRIYCANCGKKSEMAYQGEVSLNEKPKLKGSSFKL
jgi:hypothetical protein